MNLREIGLFHIVWCVSKVPVIIIMRFGENNVLGPKYIHIYKFRGWRVAGEGSHGPPYIFCLLFIKTEKSARAWPILKSNSTSFWLTKFLIRWIIKKLRNEGRKILRKWGWQVINVTELKWAGVAPCDNPTLCGQSPCLWGRRGLGARKIQFFFLSFTSQYLPFKTSKRYFSYSFHHRTVK